MTASRLNSGRGSFLGPDTVRRTRWWDLDLACGHKAERTVQYRRLGDPQRSDPLWVVNRSADDVLPPPKRVHCALCT